ASDYGTQIKNYQDQYNDILKEIGTLAKDSSYHGINLLTGGKLTVMFNETRTHQLDVQGKDIIAGMADSNIGFTNADWLPTANVNAINTANDARFTEDASVTNQATLETAIAGGAKFYAMTTDSAGLHTWTETSTYVAGIKKYMANATQETAYKTALAAVSQSVNASLDSIAKATDYLRDYSSELGNNFSIIETRQNFTEALIDVLETGSDNLVLADMNEESANYLALQTRQQLAINSLALASQSAQSVLSLF
ncbi:MAG: hypothetical protein IKK52_06695, partial [Alphaproteobacteria bacterium]|nr:hypothetical protein [Alphaproteobacteria bacterium]